MAPLRSIFAVVATLSFTACHPPESRAPGLAHVLTVTGHGEARGPSDVARITLGVEASDPSATAAVASASGRMTGVLAALRANGVAPADIQTSQLSIYSEVPQVPYPPPVPSMAPMAESRASVAKPPAPSPEPGRPQTIYHVTNSVVATVRHVDRFGDVLGAALAAGANLAGGVSFDVDEPKPLEDVARKKAMEDAYHRAEELARLGGVKLGKVLSVSEGEAETPGPTPMYAAKASRAESVPTEGGEVVVQASVHVVFRLED